LAAGRKVVVLSILALSLLGLFGHTAIIPGPMAFAGRKGVPLETFDAQVTGAPVDLAASSPADRGRYLTQAADCEACHTRPGGPPFAGGRPFSTSFGTLYSPNITPDMTTGIGSWTDQDFLRALHQGIGPDGEHLYPAFPYAAYSYLTDADVLAIKAYIFALSPVRYQAPPHTLKFPFNRRELMFIWSRLYNPDRRFEPAADRSVRWNRGAYLAEALGHCGECHTPRTLLQALNNRHKFSGGYAEGWRAYNLSSDTNSGIGSWSAEELRQYLSTGHSSDRGSAFGPMAEAVHLSLQNLTPSDIGALVAYVRTIPPVSTPDLPSPKLTRAPTNPSEQSPADALYPWGHVTFASLCAGCHAWSGVNDYVPFATLTGSRAINDPTGTNVAMALLHGASPLPTAGAVTQMPSFAFWTDAQVADLSNYVIARFGAGPSSITAADVRTLRATH